MLQLVFDFTLKAFNFTGNCFLHSFGLFDFNQLKCLALYW